MLFSNCHKYFINHFSRKNQQYININSKVSLLSGDHKDQNWENRDTLQ